MVSPVTHTTTATATARACYPHLVHVVEALGAPEEQSRVSRVASHHGRGERVRLVVLPDAAQRLDLHHHHLRAHGEMLLHHLNLLPHLHVLLLPKALLGEGQALHALLGALPVRSGSGVARLLDEPERDGSHGFLRLPERKQRLALAEVRLTRRFRGQRRVAVFDRFGVPGVLTWRA